MYIYYWRTGMWSCWLTVVYFVRCNGGFGWMSCKSTKTSRLWKHPLTCSRDPPLFSGRWGSLMLRLLPAPLDPRNLRRRKRQYLAKYLKTVLRFQPLTWVWFYDVFFLRGKNWVSLFLMLSGKQDYNPQVFQGVWCPFFLSVVCGHRAWFIALGHSRYGPHCHGHFFQLESLGLHSKCA